MNYLVILAILLGCTTIHANNDDKIKKLHTKVEWHKKQAQKDHAAAKKHQQEAKKNKGAKAQHLKDQAKRDLEAAKKHEHTEKQYQKEIEKLKHHKK